MTGGEIGPPIDSILRSLVRAHCFLLWKASLTKASRSIIGALRHMPLTLAGNRQILTDVTRMR